ncbi:helix-turn-helix domain-containing protein [Anaerolineae bacterium CFX7]|nr:helix-turn-helix domain-containing protein [Anaerolineae bacterium CFX7]
MAKQSERNQNGKRRASSARASDARPRSQGEIKMSEIFKDYITTREAADLLGIRIESVIRLVKDGRLKGEQIGKSWMVFKPSIEIYYRTKARSGHPATGIPKLAAQK